MLRNFKNVLKITLQMNLNYKLRQKVINYEYWLKVIFARVNNLYMRNVM